MAVFSSARDMFDHLDELALTFGEVSSIAKRGYGMSGAAKDPVTVRLALEEFLARFPERPQRWCSGPAVRVAR
jgi:shikimate 5-dehydrogenase